MAELARLVGYDAPVARRDPPMTQNMTPPAAPEPHRHSPAQDQVNLQDELLQDLDGYVDAPAYVGVSQPSAGYSHEAVSAREPVSFGGVEAPASTGSSASDISLADELEWSVGDVAVEPPSARSGGADPTEGYGRHRLPLANFNPVSAATSRSSAARHEEQVRQRHEPVMEPAQVDVAPPAVHAAPSVRQEPDAPEMEQDFDFGFSPEASRSPVQAAPTQDAFAQRREPPLFQPVAHSVFAGAPLAPPSREVPSFFEALARNEEVEARPVAASAYSVQEPRFEPQAASPSLDHQRPDHQRHDHQSEFQDETSVAQQEADPFGGDFDFDLEDIELDLSELEADSAPPVTEQRPPQPVAAAVAGPAAFQPSRPAEAAPVQAAAPIAEPAPQHVSEPVPLPFDAAEISDQDEHLEAVAHLDVPDLPPVEDAAPATYRQDYDFDIDSELATLLDQTVEPRSASAPSKPAQAVAAAAVAAPVAPMPPLAEQVKNMPSDDFDVFEKALEEDFRKSLDGPHSFGAKPGGPVPMPLEAEDYDDYEEPRGSRRWVAMAAAAVVVLVGGGGVYAWMKTSGGETFSSNEPKVVMADKGPVKVVPADPGGKAVPNQNKAVYDRVSGSTPDQPQQKSLISSQEEPVDVAQRTLEPDNLPLEQESEADNAGMNGAGMSGDAPQTGQNGQPGDPAKQGDQQSLSPRKVKTMIVRPDGSLVAQEAPAQSPATSQPSTAQGGAPQPAAAQPGSAAPQSVEQAMASADTATAAPAAAQDSAGVPAPNMPVPRNRPASTPVQTAAAAAKSPTPPAATPVSASPASPSTAASSGGYLVQISSLPSEADAQKSYKNLSAKFGSVIGGRGVDIKAADIPGKGTYYRVRIPAGSKDEAVSLCERYRGAGGNCMVVR
ncbi:SPOR domain-containing protein [Agrobacterium vitis]|uniref:SPOR domain-containing protein n=1 Tax=Agrobacterium vitis TaxID=373 RepID=UPI0018D21771|nr:SPOR domain-containing protein [Agrobacterium vitis]